MGGHGEGDPWSQGVIDADDQEIEVIGEEDAELIIMFRTAEGEPPSVDVDIQREGLAGLIGLGEENSVFEVRPARIDLREGWLTAWARSETEWNDKFANRPSDC